MKIEKSRVKRAGQVFTPPFVVNDMLDYCGYDGVNILKKHIIDNSCGDGAFLCAAVHRYIRAAIEYGYPLAAIKKQLTTYFHGIDIDDEAYVACLVNLDRTTEGFGIKGVKWDIHLCDALTVRDFDGRMDFVVGNPPYVRVHHLNESYDDVKKCSFTNGGMTDLYLAFFEIGFRMLNRKGVLCYITPSSWLNSLAAEGLRKFIITEQNLTALIDLGHFQAFRGVTTFTLISLFSKSQRRKSFDYYIYKGKEQSRLFIERLSLNDIHFDSKFYLGCKRDLDMLRNIKERKVEKLVTVKNGFATLADSVFIGARVPESPMTIRVFKASTGRWYSCFFPYDENGKPLPETIIFSFAPVCRYLMDNKRILQKGRTDSTGWYLYGRTQALTDVYKPKLAVNVLVRSTDDLKIAELKEGEGIYSGLYVITNKDIMFQDISRVIASSAFITYVKMLKKYKSGGYFTFNSKDLEQYLNYCLSTNDENVRH